MDNITKQMYAWLDKQEGLEVGSSVKAIEKELKTRERPWCNECMSRDCMQNCGCAYHTTDGKCTNYPD